MKDQNIDDFQNEVELLEFVHVTQALSNRLVESLGDNITEEQSHLLSNLSRQSSHLINKHQ